MSPRLSDADVLRFEFDALCAIAARVIDKHADGEGKCAACGCAHRLSPPRPSANSIHQTINTLGDDHVQHT